MADNAIVKILTALLKHQVKKVVGDETLGIIGQEIAALGGDKVDDQIKAWLGEKTTEDELEKAAQYAQTCFRDKVGDDELHQWMVSLPLGNLPRVVEALNEIPTSPDETKLENALRESVKQNWRKLTPEQVENTVNSFLSCLRSALLPIGKQTLMVIGRSTLRMEEKVDKVDRSTSRMEEKLDLLIRQYESYLITGKSVEIKQLNPEPVETWNLKHPYAMPPNFTGRVDERKMLADWLNKDNENHLFILRALGGFGKSALSWHWLTHDVDSKEWKKVLWWSFYEGDASFEHFIEETLKYLKLEVPQGQRPQVDTLLKVMQGQKILLIMDGFERALRAYSSMNAAYQGDEPKVEENQLDCVNINAEIFLKSVCSLPNIKSKVLMTTRLTPRAVKPRGEFMLGCQEEELTAIQKADAVEFFHKQKINGTRAEIEAACAPYGYHPLSLRILAGLITNDREKPGDIVVADKLNITNNIIQNKNHVLKVSYDTLLFGQQKLLSNMACIRSSISYQTLKIIVNKPSWTRKNRSRLNEKLDDSLQALDSRGLISWDRKINKYELHPIVKRYAYQQLSPSERKVAHSRLRDYFSTINTITKPQSIDDILPIIELYHHMVNAENFEEARAVYGNQLSDFLFHEHGAYQLIIELLLPLFPDGEDKPPRLRDYSWQASTISSLANSYAMSGQAHRSKSLWNIANNIYENKTKRKDHLIIGIGATATIALFPIGALREATEKLRAQINMSHEIGEIFDEANGHHELSRILSYCGIWKDAENEQNEASKLIQQISESQPENIIWAYHALRLILIARADSQSSDLNSAIQFASLSLKTIDERYKKSGRQSMRDYIRTYWLLGAAYRASGELTKAEENLSKAINFCRGNNTVEAEADILLDLARLRYDQKKTEEAKSLAEEALTITERCGYVLQGADVNLFLAQYALEQEKDKVKAKEYAEEAKKLATCDGPPYYYKVAYEEAERFLENLK